jgi:hypothetical protein
MHSLKLIALTAASHTPQARVCVQQPSWLPGLAMLSEKTAECAAAQFQTCRHLTKAGQLQQLSGIVCCHFQSFDNLVGQLRTGKRLGC